MMTEQEHNNEQCTMNNVQWKKVKLGEVIELQGGFAFQSRDFSDSGVPLIRIGDITPNGLNISNSAKLPISHLTEYENFVLNINDTVIAMSGATTGKCTLVTQKDLPALLNQRVGRFRIKNGSIDKLFLYYIVSNNVYQQKLLLDAVGGAQPNVSPKQIESVFCNVPILSDGTPNLPAQRRIAAILASADKVIAATQKTIAKYKQIKQGMMEDLLKPKEGWKMVKLGEVCMPSSEKYNPLTEDTFQYCIEMENINQESGTINGKSDITKLLSLKTKFHKGEVLYGKLRPYLKKYWLADFDGACSTEIWVLKNSENIDNQFLFYLFQSDCINRIANQSSGTKMPRADWKFMEKQTVSIPFKNDKPDLTEQRRIAAILSGIDAKIAAEEKVLEKYEKVKKGLMERLLNGKT